MQEFDPDIHQDRFIKFIIDIVLNIINDVPTLTRFYYLQLFIYYGAMPKENLKAYLAWVAVCIIWGTTYLAIRIGVQDFPPVLFAGLRWIIAGPILIIILKLRGYKLPALEDIKHLAVVGILLIGCGNGLVVFAEQWVPSGLTALLLATDPLWIVGIECLLPNGPKLNLKIVIGVLLGLAGVILIFGSNISDIVNTNYLIGIAALLFCVFCWSSGTLYSKYKKVSVHPLMGAAVQMVIAGLKKLDCYRIICEKNSHWKYKKYLSILKNY